jgi:hypothetical protein
MVQVLHGRATTTAAVRRAIQHSQESLRTLAARYGINQKTVAKWKKRNSVEDVATGPTDPKSTSLSMEDEAVVVASRRHTLLLLDDCLYALLATIPHLTRSSLYSRSSDFKHSCTLYRGHPCSRIILVGRARASRTRVRYYRLCVTRAFIHKSVDKCGGKTK